MKQTVRYANVLAKIGSERGLLLSEIKLKSLAGTRSTAEFAAQLQGTVYQERISKLPLPLNSRRLERVFQESLIDAYMKIIKNSPISLAAYLKMHLDRIELETLKALVKGVYAQLSFEEKLAEIYLNMESFLKNRGLFEEAAKATDLKQLVNTFKETEYFPRLNLGLRRYEENGSTMFFDVLLDKEFHEKLCRGYESLPRKERPRAFFYSSMEVDTFLILMLLRGKALDYDPQWLRMATPKCNFNLSNETVDALMMAADYKSAVSIVLKSNYGKFFANAPTPEETIAKAQKGFRRAVFRHAVENRITDTFNIGAPLGFMVLKEAETRNLSAISLGVEKAMKPEEILSFLLLRI